MRRTFVHRYFENSEPEIVGWFDVDSASQFPSREGPIAYRAEGVSPALHCLYLTAEGAWVRERKRQAGKGESQFEFISEVQAYVWLTRNGYEDAVDELIELPAEKSSPSADRLVLEIEEPDLRGRIEEYAHRSGLRPREAIRQLLRFGLDAVQ